MATRRFKRDQRGRFAVVDSGGASAADQRYAERQRREERDELRKVNMDVEQSKLRTARAEKRDALREFNQLKKLGRLDDEVGSQLRQRVQRAVRAVSDASIRLQQLKRSR